MDFVLVCEHASAEIPKSLGNLGLSERARFSHAAWDIGAADLAHALADKLNAPLVSGALSRLVYDCNRPLEATDCIPTRSEVFDVPGNEGLSPEERAARFDGIHRPFHAEIERLLTRAGPATALVTIHSFTPVFHGRRRSIDIGYLCDQDMRLAEDALRLEAQSDRFETALNAPYAANDGVTHTLRLHGDARGLANVMIEVRNDLIDTPDAAIAMADHLATILQSARAEVVG